MSCAPDWESPDNLDYTIFLFVLGFILPMSVILVTSVRVRLTLKNNSSRADNLGVVSHAKRKEDKVRIEHLYIYMRSELRSTKLSSPLSPPISYVGLHMRLDISFIKAKAEVHNKFLIKFNK